MSTVQWNKETLLHSIFSVLAYCDAREVKFETKR